MAKLEAIVARLPEAARVDIEAWGGEPTFRVHGKNFVFASPDATSLSVKLPKEEADAVVATDPRAEPTGYGLGRSGWISVSLPGRVSAARWREIEEWVRTSYTLIAPKRLAKLVLAEDQEQDQEQDQAHDDGRAPQPAPTRRASPRRSSRA
jgi:predicted DNA-binding protein (MmcQ/YjbR family)